MAKKQNYSISADPEQVEKIENLIKINVFPSFSRFISLAMDDKLKQFDDPYAKIKALNSKIRVLNQEKSEILQDLERKLVEGNLEERRKAQDELDRIEEKKKQRYNYLLERYNSVKDNELFKQFLNKNPNFYDVKSLLDDIGKLQTNGVMVGTSMLQEMYELKIIGVKEDG